MPSPYLQHRRRSIAARRRVYLSPTSGGPAIGSARPLFDVDHHDLVARAHFKDSFPSLWLASQDDCAACFITMFIPNSMVDYLYSFKVFNAVRKLDLNLPAGSFLSWRALEAVTTLVTIQPTAQFAYKLAQLTCRRACKPVRSQDTVTIVEDCASPRVNSGTSRLLLISSRNKGETMLVYIKDPETPKLCQFVSDFGTCLHTLPLYNNSSSTRFDYHPYNCSKVYSCRTRRPTRSLRRGEQDWRSVPPDSRQLGASILTRPIQIFKILAAPCDLQRASRSTRPAHFNLDNFNAPPESARIRGHSAQQPRSRIGGSSRAPREHLDPPASKIYVLPILTDARAAALRFAANAVRGIGGSVRPTCAPPWLVHAPEESALGSCGVGREHRAADPGATSGGRGGRAPGGGTSGERPAPIARNPGERTAGGFESARRRRGHRGAVLDLRKEAWAPRTCLRRSRGAATSGLGEREARRSKVVCRRKERTYEAAAALERGGNAAGMRRGGGGSGGWRGARTTRYERSAPSALDALEAAGAGAGEGTCDGGARVRLCPLRATRAAGEVVAVERQRWSAVGAAAAGGTGRVASERARCVRGGGGDAFGAAAARPCDAVARIPTLRESRRAVALIVAVQSRAARCASRAVSGEVVALEAASTAGLTSPSCVPRPQDEERSDGVRNRERGSGGKALVPTLRRRRARTCTDSDWRGASVDSISSKPASNDGSKQFHEDATFCPRAGLNGQGSSLQSWSYPTRYFRHFNNVLSIARSGGPQTFDSATSFNDDISFVVGAAFA
ncbi:hypothetical protein B0H15DRAFT_996609 [Mycena belliarum]|uniref:non-reducing end alpha-L-arabinofuranosidase n=1 Tax=Mycena belliarum TaxID=1033014 RepID=A0AAD6TWS6_9AGAR|nr:hypothetical protein B0H15DRAFT_996609 [Mycena belliae]